MSGKHGSRTQAGLIIRRTLLAIMGLIAVLALVGLLLPRHVPMVDTALTLEATRPELFPFFDSREGQQRLWRRAWERGGGAMAILPPMVIVDLGGPDAGEGAEMGFFPDETRLGSFAGFVSTLARGRGVITASEFPRRVVYEIDFGLVLSHRTITFEEAGVGRARVHWLESLEIANPLARYVSLFLDDSTNEGFNGVLAALEDVAISDRGEGPP